MRIKICGVTNQKDAELVAESGADAIGFVFYPESPRAVAPKTVQDIILALTPFITTVGVFSGLPKDIEATADLCGLDIIQLQGDENPEWFKQRRSHIIKTVRVKDRSSLDLMGRYQVRAWVLDTYRKDRLGGTGESFDWNLAVEARQRGRIILAGGLTPENVFLAIQTIKPDGVDVSSGVERSLGRKDPKKVRDFIEAARSAFKEIGGSAR